MSDIGFNRPTLAELNERTRADINSGIPGADARLRRSFLGVLARTLAGLAHGLYGYLDWIARQSNPYWATGKGLEAWARVWGVGRKLATKASGTAVFAGSNGAVVPAGVEIIRGDGVGYVTTDEATVSDGIVTVPIRAVTAGVDGNAAVGVLLQFVSPVAGVNSSGEVVGSALAGGTDTEPDSELRARLLDRIQSPPHGGSDADYRRWAREVPGVTRAWVAPMEMGAGTVTVRFMMDGTYPDGIPEAGDVLAVQEYIDAVRPVTAEVFVAAPVAVPLDIEITDLVPNTAAVKAAVEAELRDMIRRVAVPGGTIPVSKIWEAVSIATGEESHKITVPAGDVPHSTGEIATFGAVTYA